LSHQCVHTWGNGIGHTKWQQIKQEGKYDEVLNMQMPWMNVWWTKTLSTSFHWMNVWWTKTLSASFHWMNVWWTKTLSASFHFCFLFSTW
jgi:hypothetical protein